MLKCSCDSDEEKKKKEEQRANWALSQFLKDISQGKGESLKTGLLGFFIIRLDVVPLSQSSLI